MNLVLDVSHICKGWYNTCQVKKGVLVCRSVPVLGLFADGRIIGLTLYTAQGDTGGKKGGNPIDTMAFFGGLQCLQMTVKHSLSVLSGDKRKA